MKLVVIIPALNEDRTLPEVIGRIPRGIEGIAETEVVVVDDGSEDDTVGGALKAGARVVSHHANLGVGVALNTGMEAALRLGADVIVNMDGDGQFNPEDIPELIAPILKEDYGFVTCTRFKTREVLPRMPRMKYWGNLMMSRLINWIIWNAHFTDVSCGFRAYSRETALRMNLFGRFSYTQEMFIDLAAKNVKMTEVPLRVRGVRQHGTSRVANNLWRYATRVGGIILRAMRDTRPLKFFGGIGLTTFLFGIILGLVVFIEWLLTGRTVRFRSLLIGSGTFLTLGFLLCVMALLADMIGRLRRTAEDIRYLLRKQEYDGVPFTPAAGNEVPRDSDRAVAESSSAGEAK
jgi:glycosyltransferase involved in cell wall biosynthesis